MPILIPIDDMKKQYIEDNFKDWYKDIRQDSIIGLSDDIDSLLGAYILQELFGAEIGMFYSFQRMYFSTDLQLGTVKSRDLISVDIDLSKGKCFGNHVTYVQNDNVISLNKNVPMDTSDYYNKFAGSTVVTMMSLYNISIDDMTDEQLELLICIDGAYKQYFFNSDLFIHYYTEILEYPRFVDIVSKRDEQYFKDIISKYNLFTKIGIREDGTFYTPIKLDKVNEVLGINLQLPQSQYREFMRCETLAKPTRYFRENIGEDNIFSSAITSKGFCVATIKG